MLQFPSGIIDFLIESFMSKVDKLWPRRSLGYVHKAQSALTEQVLSFCRQKASRFQVNGHCLLFWQLWCDTKNLDKVNGNPEVHSGPS